MLSRPLILQGALLTGSLGQVRHMCLKMRVKFKGYKYWQQRRIITIARLYGSRKLGDLNALWTRRSFELSRPKESFFAWTLEIQRE